MSETQTSETLDVSTNPTVSGARWYQRFLDVKSHFVDYSFFEGDFHRRQAEEQAFLAGEEWAPRYDHPKLDRLIDNSEVRENKRLVYEAGLELEEAAKSASGAELARIELYRDFYDRQLGLIMLVEAAQDMAQATDSAASETARESFMNLNEMLFGEFNQRLYKGMLASEASRVANFMPANDVAASIKHQLGQFLTGENLEGFKEPELFNQEQLDKLKAFVLKLYERILAQVPDTDDGVSYNSQQIADIMEGCLKAGGLYDKGWRIEVDPKKTAPATKVSDKKIFIPEGERRTANRIKALVLHEQEVHARRGQNGLETGEAPLENGTADYADVEEGLGLILEMAIAGKVDNPAYERARDRYITAGLALGETRGDDGRDARETFEILWRLIAVRNSANGHIDENSISSAQSKAYTHIVNAFRSTASYQKGTIYMKLKVYYEGLQKNAQYFTENMDNLGAAFDTAMIGKYNHTDPKERELVQEVLAA